MGFRHRAGKRKNRGNCRGFTLVELLTVVAITGVLAAVGVTLVRQHLQDAKSGDAIAGIIAIKQAQEAHRAETGNYQNCSVSSGTPWYPVAPDGTVHAWSWPAHADWLNWRQLNVQRRETQFGFLVHAGMPAQDLPVPLTTSQPIWPTAAQRSDPWYVIQAAGDRDADGTLSRFLAASFNGEVFTENDGE